MDAQTNIADRKYLDPDFLAVGMEVYTYEYIEELRKQNLELKGSANGATTSSRRRDSRRRFLPTRPTSR